jgi:signal transduction histidine kinase
MHKLEGLQGQISNSAKLSSIGAISLDMAHQIKNPLTILLGRLENLLEGVAEESPVRRDLDSAVTAGWRIQELTQNFASIGNQKPIEIDVNDLLNDAFAIAGIRNRGRIQTHWDCQEDLPKISGNPVLLREALSNIFSNAMEAVSPDGLIATSASGADGTVVISISNDGAGIPQHVMDHLFEPFQSTKANGSGLGLFAAKHIVEMHRGSVSVENNEGRGTSVRISLPAHLQESRESQRDDSDIPLPISSR